MRPGRLPALLLAPLLTTGPVAQTHQVTVTEGTNIAVTAAPRTGAMVMDLQENSSPYVAAGRGR
ncbi:hypothetical protein GCM10029964_107020 [Kibdelosporangium lantanae]